LNQLVREFLVVNIEYYAIADSYPAVVDKLLDELDRSHTDLLKLLLNILARTTRPDLKSAISDYIGITQVHADPYSSLLVFDLPFVDRETFRRKLRDMFDGPYKRVLLVRGAQGSGRTYCQNLIQHVANARGIVAVSVDLLATRDPDDLIGEIINSLSLDPKQLRDRIAQLSAKGKGLATALRGEGNRFVREGQRWCIVIDHFDRDEVSVASRELFLPLIEDVARWRIANVWVIVLGFAGHLEPNTLGAVLDDEIANLSQPDVDRYLTEIIGQRGTTGVQRENLLREIFDGLATPLRAEALTTMSARLSERLASI
jgi:hypothetical protein